MSPNAVTAPVIFVNTNTNIAASNKPRPAARVATTTGEAHHAIAVAAAINNNVFAKCSPITTARLTDASFTTSSFFTSTAPTNPSTRMKKNVANAARSKRRSPNRHAHTINPIPNTPHSPLVTRCVNSIIVFAAGATGTTSPLHNGQWFPHPAPAPAMRTHAPNRITAIKYPANHQAQREKVCRCMLILPAYSGLGEDTNQTRIFG